ncbi:MAG TPA: 23S rRNA (adenine(2503)-C(2))-methyltransferase RlmN [Terriglobia bacterium]|nr:23S rRNA (adenine(2503)-C(2))-methyltransferase RlmN [Terriglobia bacterium]
MPRVAPNLPNLIGLTRAELEGLALELGQPRYRGRQLYNGLYRRLLRSPDKFTTLDRATRRDLAERYEITYPGVLREITSSDQSVRYLLGLADGESVEAVYMPWRAEQRNGRTVATPSGRELRPHSEAGVMPTPEPLAADEVEESRTTLCISSQVGCAVACSFCFTGLMGARRNLTPGEIVGQVLTIARERGLWSVNDGQSDRGRKAAPRVNIVFMGQGEPLLNLRAVMGAVGILADTEGCAIPLRRITISTAGIVPRVYDLAREPVRPKLAISLNASNDEQRDLLMPINRKYPLSVLMEACRAYPLRPRERLTFEYVMLDGVNDASADAVRVARLLEGLPARVNLIPYNGGAALSYRPSPMERVHSFQNTLRERGVPAFIRISRGQDIMAACGQLSLEGARGQGSV